MSAPQDAPRCERCGWPLAQSVEDGCVEGNCSMRPLPPVRFPVQGGHFEGALDVLEAVGQLAARDAVLRVWDAYLAQREEIADVRAALARAQEDAARWRYFRRFLSVENDVSEGGQYLFIDDMSPELPLAPGFENTVDSLVDAAIDAARAAQPPEGGR